MGSPGELVRVGERPVIFARSKCAAQGLQYSNAPATLRSMPRVSPPTDRVVATMTLLAARPGRRADAGRAHPTSRRQQVDRARHPHQPRRRRLGAARSRPQDLPARPRPRRGRPHGRRLVPGPRLRPPGHGRPERRARRHLCRAGRRATTRSPCSTRSAGPARRSASALPGGRGVPAAAAVGRGGAGVGRRRRARRVAGARAARHPRLLPRRAAPPPTTGGSRSRSRPPRSHASASS